AARDCKPNYIANYLFELATMFNEYYHKEHVIGSKNEFARLQLVEAVRIVLGNGLKLLGIEPLEEM
ncbi:arginine--tRNA ligase, partial [Candidatus Pacearchaeota archaeon]|nr:arginine--tRNA ligase [Candidatus Pacearchaeota archaeon]